MTNEKKQRVLLVDDCEDTLTIIGHYFEKCGADVMKLTKGAEAMDLVRLMRNAGTPFQLVVLDIRMPELNGNTIARSLREEGHSGGIVAFTAVPSGTGRGESKDAGFDSYMSKSTINSDLINALLQKYCN